MLKWIILYLVAVNALAIILTVSDKRRARHHRWRIPEAVLLLTAALGGSPAMLITMKKIHHKTHHIRFMWGIPAIIVVQVAVVLLWLYTKYGGTLPKM